MKIRNSLKSLMKRHRDNQLVRRKGRVFIINKTQKRFKAARAEASRGPPGPARDHNFACCFDVARVRAYLSRCARFAVWRLP